MREPHGGRRNSIVSYLPQMTPGARAPAFPTKSMEIRSGGYGRASNRRSFAVHASLDEQEGPPGKQRGPKENDEKLRCRIRQRSYRSPRRVRAGGMRLLGLMMRMVPGRRGSTRIGAGDNADSPPGEIRHEARRRQQPHGEDQGQHDAKGGFHAEVETAGADHAIVIAA